MSNLSPLPGNAYSLLRSQLPVIPRGRYIINDGGVFRNSFHDEIGRGGYFHQASGTSEGQILGILSASLCYQATADEWYANLAAELYASLFSVGSPEGFPTQSTLIADINGDNPYAFHWLYNASNTDSDKMYGDIWDTSYGATFTNSVATITLPTNLNVRSIMRAIDQDAPLTWDNPYADPLNAVSIDSVDLTVATEASGTDTIYTITINDAAVSGWAGLYIYRDGSEEISPSTVYEAWPYWRNLEAGELDVAADSVWWSYAAFKAFGSGDEDKVLKTAAAILEPDDGNNWITLNGQDSIRPNNATYINWLTDVNGYTAIPVLDTDEYVSAEAGFSMDYGSETNAYIPYTYVIDADEYTAGTDRQIEYGYGDLGGKTVASITHMKVDIAGISAGSTVTIFLNTESIDGTNWNTRRYSKSLTLTDADNVTEFLIPIAEFLNVGTASITVDDIGILQQAGMRVTGTAAVTVMLQGMRPLPSVDLKYSPGVFPFTANYLHNQLINWRGLPITGYMSLYFAKEIATYASDSTWISNAVLFLKDAQLDYASDALRCPASKIGPFSPSYVWERNDILAPGGRVVDTFTWEGDDPNTSWGGYQYRTLTESAKYLHENSATYLSDAYTIVANYINYINNAWLSSTDIFASPLISNFPEDAEPDYSLYDPHMVALVVRSCFYFDTVATGGDITIGRALMEKALNELKANQLIGATSYNGYEFGEPADIRYSWGFWDAAEGVWKYYGFWNSEILVTLALLAADEPTYTALGLTVTHQEILDMISGNKQWLMNARR